MDKNTLKKIRYNLELLYYMINGDFGTQDIGDGSEKSRKNKLDEVKTLYDKVNKEITEQENK